MQERTQSLSEEVMRTITRSEMIANELMEDHAWFSESQRTWQKYRTRCFVENGHGIGPTACSHPTLR